jgi:hypothetical protein
MCGANSGFPIHSGSHCFSIDSHGTFLRDLQRPAIHSSLLWAWQLGGKRLSFYLRSSPAYFLSHYFRICDLLLEIMQRPFRRPIRLNRVSLWQLRRARVAYVSYRLFLKSRSFLEHKRRIIDSTRTDTRRTRIFWENSPNYFLVSIAGPKRNIPV